MAREIKLCPFRTYTEVRPAIMQGQGDMTIMDFMPCLKAKCPAWCIREEEIPCTGRVIDVECCKRLEKA